MTGIMIDSLFKIRLNGLRKETRFLIAIHAFNFKLWNICKEEKIALKHLSSNIFQRQLNKRKSFGLYLLQNPGQGHFLFLAECLKKAVLCIYTRDCGQGNYIQLFVSLQTSAVQDGAELDRLCAHFYSLSENSSVNKPPFTTAESVYIQLFKCFPAI